jgi:hypothetical protein
MFLQRDDTNTTEETNCILEEAYTYCIGCGSCRQRDKLNIDGKAIIKVKVILPARMGNIT